MTDKTQPIDTYPYTALPEALKDKAKALNETAMGVKWCPFMNSTCKRDLCALWGDGECTQRRR